MSEEAAAAFGAPTVTLTAADDNALNNASRKTAETNGPPFIYVGGALPLRFFYQGATTFSD
jgi:hypothetical protein